MKNYRYAIRDTEAGNMIAKFETLEAAELELAAYEAEDKKDGTYTPDFYEVIELEEVSDDAAEIIDAGLYDAAVALMDDEIREELHAELAPCSDGAFLTAYMKRHLDKFGTKFTI